MSRTAELRRLAEWRRAFDNSFAAPALRPAANAEPMIAIQVAGQAFALRVLEMAGLVKAKGIVPVPSRIRELMSLAGVRNTLVAVYDLAAPLGCMRRAGEPHWLALVKGEPQLALAFDEIEGLFDVERARVYTGNAATAIEPVSRLVQIGPVTRTVIDIPAVIRTIRGKAGVNGSDFQ